MVCLYPPPLLKNLYLTVVKERRVILLLFSYPLLLLNRDWCWASVMWLSKMATFACPKSLICISARSLSDRPPLLFQAQQGGLTHSLIINTTAPYIQTWRAFLACTSTRGHRQRENLRSTGLVNLPSNWRQSKAVPSLIPYLVKLKALILWGGIVTQCQARVAGALSCFTAHARGSCYHHHLHLHRCNFRRKNQYPPLVCFVLLLWFIYDILIVVVPMKNRSRSWEHVHLFIVM